MTNQYKGTVIGWKRQSSASGIAHGRSRRAAGESQMSVHDCQRAVLEALLCRPCREPCLVQGPNSYNRASNLRKIRTQVHWDSSVSEYIRELGGFSVSLTTYRTRRRPSENRGCATGIRLTSCWWKMTCVATYSFVGLVKTGLRRNTCGYLPS